MEQSILFVNDALASHGGQSVEIKAQGLNTSDVFRHPAVTIVAAVGRDNAIGRNGDLIWHISEDLRHFKRVTLGGAVVMGRKTWESLPRRPLPGRLNIVVSRNPDYKAEGATVASSLEEALSLAAGNDTFVIGGGEVYAQSLRFASRLILTEVDAETPDADTFFPVPDASEWERTEVKEPEEATVPSIRFVIWLRKSR